LSVPSSGPCGPSASLSAPSRPLRGAEQLSALLHDRGRGLADATTADIQDYIIDVIERRRPSTANNRFRSLHRFFVWLEEEKEIPNPMRRLKPPTVPEDPVPVVDDDALRRLFETCEDRGFEERRDTAILYLFLDAGPRLEELSAILVGTSTSTST
jgi:integrase/recombinase XerC